MIANPINYFCPSSSIAEFYKASQEQILALHDKTGRGTKTLLYAIDESICNIFGLTLAPAVLEMSFLNERESR